MLVTCIGGPLHGEQRRVDDAANHFCTLRRTATSSVSRQVMPIFIIPPLVEYKIDTFDDMAYCISEPEIEIKFIGGLANGLKRMVNVRAKTANCFEGYNSLLATKHVYTVVPLACIATFHACSIVNRSEAPPC